jgi:hypothetical protein
VASLNNTKTRMIGTKPADAIKLERVVSFAARKPPVPLVSELTVGTLVHVAANEEAKSVDEKRRATDPFWTAEAHPIARRIDKGHFSCEPSSAGDSTGGTQSIQCRRRGTTVALTLGRAFLRGPYTMKQQPSTKQPA